MGTPAFYPADLHYKVDRPIYSLPPLLNASIRILPSRTQNPCTLLPSTHHMPFKILHRPSTLPRFELYQFASTLRSLSRFWHHTLSFRQRPKSTSPRTPSSSLPRIRVSFSLAHRTSSRFLTSTAMAKDLRSGCPPFLVREVRPSEVWAGSRA